MKTRNNVLEASFQGDDVAAMVRQAVAGRPEFARVPQRATSNSTTIALSNRWLDEALATFKGTLDDTLYAFWPDGGQSPAWPLLSARNGAVKLHLRADWNVQCVVDYARSLGAWFAVFDHYFYESTRIEDDQDHDKGWSGRRGIEGGHVDLGWGCLFVGERGHQQLVSRRWLEFGPWWLRRFPGDVSLVQFHDLDANAETAFAQATPGHSRMSDHDIGGWLRSSYRPGSSIAAKGIPEFRALYVPDDQSLRVVCAPGRVVSQREMLDACAERLVAKYNTEKPVRSLRYVFIDPADADKHMHEMWLRDIEVWAIVDGNEVRLDDKYHPTPTPPDWVRDVQARGDQ